MSQSTHAALLHKSVAKDDLLRLKHETEPDVSFRPVISEVDFMFEPRAGEQSPLPGFLNDPAAAYAIGVRKDAIHLAGAQPYHDPESLSEVTHWHRISAYAFAGFPRDLIDGVFGAASFIPVLNFAITGAYEYSGAQFLMRHRNDAHLYGGHANENNHGWIDGESWGWFSNFHQTSFSEVDDAKLKNLQAHNQQVEDLLKQKKEEAESGNLSVDLLATEYLMETLRIWEEGQQELALARLRNMCLARPNDYKALSYYLACLVHTLDSGATDKNWLTAEIRQCVTRFPPSHYDVLTNVTRERVSGHPERLAPRLLLTWTYARMGSWYDALTEAEAMVSLPNAGLREHTLYAEVILQRLPVETDSRARADLLQRLSQTVGRMNKLAPAALDTRLAATRLKLMQGHYDEAIKSMAMLEDEHPQNAALPYHLGMAYMIQGMNSDEYSRWNAKRSLRRAQKLANGSARAEVIAKALEAAGEIR